MVGESLEGHFLHLRGRYLPPVNVSMIILSDRKLLEKSGYNCFVFLEEQIKTLKPTLVITLGVIPNKVFSKKYDEDLPMGFLHTIGKYSYLPLYHPSPASPYGHKNNFEILNRLNQQINEIINR
jgi:uracil-DNA glycosylase